MFDLQGALRWSASDLTLAAECEYALLRRVDVLQGRMDRLEVAPDPLMDQIARLGDQHEERLLGEYEATARDVVLLARAARMSEAALEAVQAATLDALGSGADVIYQAGFYDGESLGYADFLERTPQGWVVCDAKLAREARPKALLQLGAYAEQLLRARIPLAPTVALLLGSGQREEFSLRDIRPVFLERRARLRHLLADRSGAAGPVAWGDERYVACGHCPECSAAIEETSDLLLVAGLRLDQRRKLRQAGITSLADLAAAQDRPLSLSTRTFATLRAQAALQLTQRQESVEGQPPTVSYELTPSAPETLAALPAPSPGDLFFDFEGDPLYNEGDLSRWGLEYLWGVLQAPQPGRAEGRFTPLWAHDSRQERAAYVEFMDLVRQRRERHPDLHIYHYAAYETSALKRLAARYQTHEAELDDLLRAAVFVDLYAVVRGSVRISQPSYSIKKLEPLYMGAELRTGTVQAGDASIVEYHEYRAAIEVGDDETAQAKLTALADYNCYDCLSTLRLRDWLLERADDLGLGDRIGPKIAAPQDDDAADADGLFQQLTARSGPDARVDRTAEEQAYAMLATALDYYRREDQPFWWAHFDRLRLPVADWDGQRDVFIVEGHELVQDWTVPPRSRNPRRVLRLRGEWGPGSTVDQQAGVGYSAPIPECADVPADGQVGAVLGQRIRLVEGDDAVIELEESCSPALAHDEVPSAVFPDAPPRAGVIRDAIREVGQAAAGASTLPHSAAFDLLARRAPRLAGGAALPRTGDPIDDVVAALLAAESSYVAIQGPPGTGKTRTGSRVVRRLVEEHGWRVGVVAQSHAVVEHMLDAIVGAGLDPALVAKSNARTTNPGWTEIGNDAKSRSAYLKDHAASGCVLGGTAWTFAAPSLIARAGLDLLVIDEAGQFALAPTIGASVVAQRLLLLGDPQQLPQVSQGTHAEPVDQSALGWLMDGRDTIPEELGYFLGTSYRMHPDLCTRVSNLSYDGRLGAAPTASARSLAGVEPGLTVLTVDHRDNRTESVEEARAVVEVIRDLIDSVWSDPADATSPRPLGEQGFLVVAPYNAQVSCIRRELVKAGYDGIRVGTVDKFQGQEAPVVVVSMTASSRGDVPRGMAFLLNRNRVNVAISRAQWRAVVIRSTELTSYLPRTTHELLALGAFLGLATEVGV